MAYTLGPTFSLSFRIIRAGGRERVWKGAEFIKAVSLSSLISSFNYQKPYLFHYRERERERKLKPQNQNQNQNEPRVLHFPFPFSSTTSEAQCPSPLCSARQIQVRRRFFSVVVFVFSDLASSLNIVSLCVNVCLGKLRFLSCLILFLLFEPAVA